MTASGDIEFGLSLPTSAPVGLSIDVQAMAATAEWAEKAGFDSAWVADHIFHPVQLLECLTTIAFVAARTRTIKLGSGVLMLPMRQLSVAIKQFATLATLSEGRFRLGIGVGGEWPAEWTAAGVPTSERGARIDEALPLLKRLFAGETVDFAGRFNTFPSVSLAPPPPPIPLWFAGRAPAAMQRAALNGEGWLGYLLTLNGFRRDREALAAIREEAGLADQPFTYGLQISFRFDKDNDGAARRAAAAHNSIFPPELTLTPVDKLQNFVVAGTPERVAEQLQAYVDAGCGMFSINAISYGQEARDHLAMFAAEVMPRLKGR